MSEGTMPGGAPTGVSPGAPGTGSWTAPGTPSWTAPGSPQPGHGAPAAYPPGTAHPPGAGGSPGQPAWTAPVAAYRPGTIALRPLSLGDVVEGAFASLRRNPRTFLGLALLTSLAVLLVVGLLALAGYLLATLAGSGADSSRTLDLLMAFGVTTAAAALLFVSSATSVALSGILAYPVAEGVLGRAPSMGETWRRTRRTLPRLLGLSAVLVVPPTVVFAVVIALTIWGFADGLPALGLLGIVGVVALAVVATWLGIRVSLATPALVLEDLRVPAALRRSWALTAGLFWRTLGILAASSVLIGIVQYVLSVAVQIGGLLLGLAIASMLGDASSDTAAGVTMAVASVSGGLLSGIVTQPFLAAVLALLYTDGRIRKEGFDLALVRAAAGATRPPRP